MKGGAKMVTPKFDFRDLNVYVAGVRLRTPIAAGPVDKPAIRDDRLTLNNYAGIFMKHIESGAGFINLPFSLHIPEKLLSDLQKRAKRIAFSKPFRTKICLKPGPKSLSLYLLGGYPSLPEKGAGLFKRETEPLIRILKKMKPKDVPLVGNIGGLGFFPETFAATAKAHEQAGVDLVELNLSSPGSLRVSESIEGYFTRDFPLINPGLFLGDQPDLAEETTREVVKAVDVPVGVKISSETGFPRVIELARRIRDAGAKYIVCSNLGVTIAPPNIRERGDSNWLHIDGNPFCDIGGDWLRPCIYKQVAAIAKFVPGIDIVACGGLTAPEHVVEVMMLGAKAVEVVTAMLYRGRKLIKKDLEFLIRYMKEYGFRSVSELAGLALQHIKFANDLSFRDDLIAEVDSNRCTGCGICTDHVCLSMVSTDGSAKVDATKCTGCGICAATCPTGAVRLRPVSA
jgi:dihydropyrimidine dehydrogenase (NAD+) subunit PreA